MSGPLSAPIPYLKLLSDVLLLLRGPAWDFPVGPVVKTSTSNAGGAGLIPDRGAKIPHALGTKKKKTLKKKKKRNQYCNKFNKDFKKWSTSKKEIKKKKEALPDLILCHLVSPLELPLSTLCVAAHTPSRPAQHPCSLPP